MQVEHGVVPWFGKEFIVPNVYVLSLSLDKVPINSINKHDRKIICIMVVVIYSWFEY